MGKKKVLIVTQELDPYTALSEISATAKQLLHYAHEDGMEIRVLMPRFGLINERRHRLHEVVRLSGINIIVDDDDYPLLIKVASYPGTRLQVYFLDNTEFFKRKAYFTDEEGNMFADNAERMVFFCKGIFETVKKFGWSPDIIHAHGWMTGLIPFYLRTVYKTDPLFRNAKVLYSVYEDPIENACTGNLITKAAINNLEEEDFSVFRDGKKISLHAGAVAYADGVIVGSENLNDRVKALIEKSGKPVLDFTPDETVLSSEFKALVASLHPEEINEVEN